MHECLAEARRRIHRSELSASSKQQTCCNRNLQTRTCSAGRESRLQQRAENLAGGELILKWMLKQQTPKSELLAERQERIRQQLNVNQGELERYANWQSEPAKLVARNLKYWLAQAHCAGYSTTCTYYGVPGRYHGVWTLAFANKSPVKVVHTIATSNR